MLFHEINSIKQIVQERTGMVLVEVELVTGWEADRPEDLVKVEEYSVQRVEHDKEDNKVDVANSVQHMSLET